jgi:hypothetical protein
MARPRKAASQPRKAASKRKRAAAARPTASAKRSSEFTCPECERTFGRAAALGAHRRRAHGVVGATASAGRASGRGAPASGGHGSRIASGSRGRGQGVDRDRLLAALFPQGVPPRVEIMRAANQWLDDAERLAAMR